MKKSWQELASKLAKAAAITVFILVAFALVGTLIFALLALAFWTLYSLGEIGFMVLMFVGVAVGFVTLYGLLGVRDNQRFVTIATAIICFAVGLVIANLVAGAYGHQPACAAVYLVYLVFVNVFIAVSRDYY